MSTTCPVCHKEFDTAVTCWLTPEDGLVCSEGCARENEKVNHAG